MDDETPDPAAPQELPAEDRGGGAGAESAGTGGAPGADEARRRGPSRRWVLAGGAVAVVGAGAGVTARLLRHSPSRRPAADRVPAALRAAVAAEQQLIADLDATTGGTAGVRAAVRAARADHAAHLAALQALVAAADPAPAPSATPTGTAAATRSAPRGTPRTRAQLSSAELRASVAGARRAGELTGPTAALLASIAACEATHAELLR